MLGAWSPLYVYPSGQRRAPAELVNIDLGAFGVPSALVDKRLPFSGSGTTSVALGSQAGGSVGCAPESSTSSASWIRKPYEFRRPWMPMEYDWLEHLKSSRRRTFQRSYRAGMDRHHRS